MVTYDAGLLEASAACMMQCALHTNGALGAIAL